MPKPLPDELYHYTGIQGLKGILESQTLWATNYKFLNDAEEITHFRDRLPDILRPVFKNLFTELTPRQTKILFDSYPTVEIAVNEESEKLATIMYDVTFGSTRDEASFADPYITSFCSVDKMDERTANHGLLSQWHSYGTQGGYAIVFDTKGLDRLLHEEASKWGYSMLFSGDVVYSSATDEEVRDEFSRHIDVIQRNWESALRSRDSNALGNMYNSFLACACRYKHWGFAEEKEYRIVAITTPPKIIENARAQGKIMLPKKPVSSFLRDGTAIPYHDLFEGIGSSSGERLPIKRLIVGPHPEKEKRKLAVEQLLNQNNIHADVSVSAIPYQG